MQTFIQDVRYALRILFKKPALTAVAMLTLAVGIGANSTIFSVVDALALRPLPFRELNRLMLLWTVQNERRQERQGTTPADFFDWRSQNTVFDEMAAYSTFISNMNITGIGEPEHVAGARVSANFFRVLDVTPAMGRDFQPEEEEPGRHRVAIVSHTLWQQRFSGDPGIIGRTLVLNGERTTVIGVLPSHHHFPLEQDIWTPLAFTAEERGRRDQNSLAVIARLKDGVSKAQAQAEMTTIAGRIAAQYPQTHTGWDVRIQSLQDQASDELAAAFSFTLFGAVAFVLLIACANVANLQLARATRRQKEIAIRSALGAGRWRVVRQLLTESVLLSVFAGLVGLLIALWGIDVVKALLPQSVERFVPMWNVMGLDTRVLTFTTVVVVLTGILSGLAPAIQTSRIYLNDILTDGTRGSSGGIGRRRLRSGLVISEVALALVLLIGAGLMIQGFTGMVNRDPGFEPKNVLTMRITLPEARYTEPHQARLFYRQAYERLGTIPGVQSVGGANYLHADNTWDDIPVEIEGHPALQHADLPRINRHIVSAGYGPTMRIPLLQGRWFEDGDHEQAPSVAVVSRSMAQRYWPDQDPVGRRIKIAGAPSVDENVPTDASWRTVVGVVEDATYNWFETQPRATVYLPAQQVPRRWMNVVLRISGDPASIASAARTQIAGLDPEQAIANIRMMTQLISDRLAGVQLGAWMMGIFGIIALIMAAVGIYSVMAYSVAQRTSEIGIRMAVGARQYDVQLMVLRNGLTLAVVGLVLGLPVAYALSTVISGALGAAVAFNAGPFVIFTLLLVGVATLSSYIPARRATQIDPMEALRYE